MPTNHSLSYQSHHPVEHEEEAVEEEGTINCLVADYSVFLGRFGNESNATAKRDHAFGEDKTEKLFLGCSANRFAHMLKSRKARHRTSSSTQVKNSAGVFSPSSHWRGSKLARNEST
jgi:hypothetical protein